MRRHADQHGRQRDHHRHARQVEPAALRRAERVDPNPHATTRGRREAQAAFGLKGERRGHCAEQLAQDHGHVFERVGREEKREEEEEKEVEEEDRDQIEDDPRFITG